MKILIIEDNEQDQKIISRYLSKRGFNDVTVVDNGEKGIETALEQKPQAILVDTILPGIDGFETCYQLKCVHHLKAPVIIMTGRIDAVDADKARRKGADDYCVKTADYALLLESLDKVTGSSATTVPAPAVEPQRAEPAAQTDPSWGLEKTNQLIKELYRELEKKNAELQKLDNLKSEFVSTVSHELRTPLTIIKGALSQIVEGLYGPVSNEQKEKLEMALRGTDLLKRIINDLLDIAKLEEKKVTLNRERLDLSQLVRDTAESCRSLAQDKGLTIQVKIPPAPVQIEADRDRITQVLTNLIGNAVKFTEQGGIQVSVAQEAGQAVCRIKDTGRGIAKENLPKVFDKFQQFGKSFSPGQEGTGLGLSICKGIIELHKGDIWVDSTLGQGTEFAFSLPQKVPIAARKSD